MNTDTRGLTTGAYRSRSAFIGVYRRPLSLFQLRATSAPQLKPAPNPANTTGPGDGSHSDAAISMDADDVLPYLETFENISDASTPNAFATLTIRFRFAWCITN